MRTSFNISKLSKGSSLFGNFINTASVHFRFNFSWLNLMTYTFYFTGSFFLVTFGVLLWMKWHMKASKGRFALSVVSSLMTCLFFGLTSMSSSLPVAITSKLSEILGFGPIETTAPNYVVLVITIFAIYCIYRFGRDAIMNWDVPPTVSEVDLAEKYLENNIAALSMEQLRLFFRGQADPVASDAIANWKEKLFEVPKPVETKDLLRDMLVSVFRELQLPNEGWRDEGKLWVGDMLGFTPEQTKSVIAFVFNERPDEKNIRKRISDLNLKEGDLADFRFFALYLSTNENTCQPADLNISDCKVEVFSSRQMILRGLDLKNYAIEIIKIFENTRVGGTSATLKNSFVDLNVQTSKEDSSPKPLNAAIDDWLMNTSNGHIAITGEYGQGKSTALMKHCADWARRFLKTGQIGERVPLLIELRGQSPSETDPLGFISSWCTRYRLLPHQVMNLIKSGDAVLIFEGFDELRNAGRAYYRHQHFNALWRFAYPNTKIIFTGRPNFFLDEEEVNRTLRNQTNRATGGDCYSEVWKLQKLSIEQIKLACRSYEPHVRAGIISSIGENSDFLDIVCRPSMLPVVATIWPEIVALQKTGLPLTGAELIEIYVQAVFSRKEAELERDRVQLNAPSGSRYLLLPKQLRELLTICVAWRMSGLKYKNTIPRSSITDMVREAYDTIIAVGKSIGVSPEVAEGIVEFEKRHADVSLAERVEAMTAEICSAGLLVSDAAGGATNLRFPHKQFFEFLIAKAITITSDSNAYSISKVILKCSNDNRVISHLKNEQNSINYLSECIGPNIRQILTPFQRINMQLSFIGALMNYQVIEVFAHFALRVLKLKIPKSEFEMGEGLLPIERYTADMFDLNVHSQNRVINYIQFSVLIPLTSLVFFFAFSGIFIPENNFIGLLGLGIAFTTLGLIIYLQILNGDNNQVIISFLRAHWRHSEQAPINLKDELRLAINSLSKGRVVFPNEKINPPSDYSQFVYPAKDFGKSS
ncbi:MAG: hypothetical protein ACI9YE_002658 [Psychroserpens sp.]